MNRSTVVLGSAFASVMLAAVVYLPWHLAGLGAAPTPTPAPMEVAPVPAPEPETTPVLPENWTLDWVATSSGAKCTTVKSGCSWTVRCDDGFVGQGNACEGQQLPTAGR